MWVICWSRVAEVECLRIFPWQNKDDQFGNHFNVSSAISWPLISFKVKFAIFTIHIIHKCLCCQLSTFIITLFHPVLFYITHGDGWGVVLINSAAPRLLAHSCWGVSPIQVLVSHPYTQRHLTHTPNDTSPIHPTTPHPYTQRGLTHRTFHVLCLKVRNNHYLYCIHWQLSPIFSLCFPLRVHRAHVISRTQRIIFRSSSACYFAQEDGNWQSTS